MAGTLNFLLCRRSSQLRGAASCHKGRKGRFVYQTLLEKAESTQGANPAMAARTHIEHRSFYIVNHNFNKRRPAAC